MTGIGLRGAVAGALLLAVGLWAWTLSSDPASRGLVFSLLTGTAFGILLQRARFCFLCNFRDFVDQRDPRGLVAIVAALAAGCIVYAAVMSAWLPVPAAGRLPPNAHVGPVGPVLAIGAFVFGLGMAISGSCLSAHLYRLGEGSPTAPFALIGAAAGFLAGFLTWNPLYLWSVSESPATWLPHRLGHGGALILAMALLATALAAIVAAGRPRPATPAAPGLGGLLRAVFVERWPPALAGIAIGVLSGVYYFRVAPLGVTAELGSLVRTAGTDLDLLPGTLHGLDGLRGCATAVKQALLSNNGLLVAGLVAGSLAAALPAGAFRPALPTPAQVAKGLAGGVLLGWGAMTSLGCTVGVLLSGIHAGAVSGWVFLACCMAGTWLGLRATRLFG